MRKIGVVSFLLGVCFYVWWFGWAALSMYVPSILQYLFWGLPVWFWLSSVLSLLLLFCAVLYFLPNEESAKEDPKA